MSYRGMHNPPHPGELFRELWLDGQGLTVSAAAECLGISRKTLSNIVNERAPVSAETAMRIELAFHHDATVWLRLQANYDAWQVQAKRTELAQQVRPISTAA